MHAGKPGIYSVSFSITEAKSGFTDCKMPENFNESVLLYGINDIESITVK